MRNVLSETIKQARRQLMTQRQAAIELCMNINEYSQIENDRIFVSQEVLNRINKILGTKINLMEIIQEYRFKVFIYKNEIADKYFFKIENICGSSEYFDSIKEASMKAEGIVDALNDTL